MGKFWQSMMGSRQTIAVMITFRNYNEKSLQRRVGVYRSNTKKEHPLLRILRVLNFLTAITFKFILLWFRDAMQSGKKVYRHWSNWLPPIPWQVYTSLPAMEFWRRIMRMDRRTQLLYMLFTLCSECTRTHTHTHTHTHNTHTHTQNTHTHTPTHTI